MTDSLPATIGLLLSLPLLNPITTDLLPIALKPLPIATILPELIVPVFTSITRVFSPIAILPAESDWDFLPIAIDELAVAEANVPIATAFSPPVLPKIAIEFFPLATEPLKLSLPAIFVLMLPIATAPLFSAFTA